MSLRNIGIVYRKELREALRDRRTVVASIIVPLFLFPLLSVGFMSLVSNIANKAEESSILSCVWRRGCRSGTRSAASKRFA